MQFAFDAGSVEPMQPLGALAPGRYEFAIVDTEIKTAKSGQGQYLQVTSDVIGGPLSGRKLFDRFNIAHANKQAEDIGKGQLAALCAAVGVVRFNDTSELHGRRWCGDVRIDRNNDTGAESNRVTAYMPASSAVPGGQQQAPQQPAAPFGNSAPPPAAFVQGPAPAAAPRMPWQR